MAYNNRYYKRLAEDPLPQLQEHERIYLNVSYRAKAFAQYCHCGFDPEKKLWFTGLHNSHLETLVRTYGVNEETTGIMQQRLRDTLNR